MTPLWTNWSGSVSCIPETISIPQSEAAIIEVVNQAQRSGVNIRVAGTGHSFVPLCASDGILLSLDKLQGIAPLQPAANPYAKGELESRPNEVSVWAGTKIHEIGDPLWAMGLAMENMGDIDRQTIAGAISTGTHGTGHTLGSISTQVVGLQLVIASGELVKCSPTIEPEIFKAAQVSLGALGIITQVTLLLLPAYQLHERTWVAAFDECIANLEQHINANRHFEFFWSPREDTCAMKALNPVATDQAGQSVLPLSQKHASGSEVRGRLARYIREERIDRSYRIFPSERNLKFNETEFAVPAASGPDCLHEIRHLMQTKYSDIIWPIEYRTLAADDIYLSPAYQRPTVTISVHQAAELPYQPFFADVEAIFRNHQGRPHWGKVHTHTAHRLCTLYPMWERFQAVCQQLDPTGLFINTHLHSTLK